MSRALLALVCSASLMSCIITREPDYSEPPNTPAVILPTPEFPFNSVIDVNLDELTGAGDGGITTQVEFTAIIRDPDVGQRLSGLVWVDFNPDLGATTPVAANVDIRAREDGVTRDVSFAVQSQDLLPGCHAVELRVSERFVDFPPVPEDDDDLGTAVWWVMSVNDLEPDVNMSGCQ